MSRTFGGLASGLLFGEPIITMSVWIGTITICRVPETVRAAFLFLFGGLVGGRLFDKLFSDRLGRGASHHCVAAVCAGGSFIRFVGDLFIEELLAVRRLGLAFHILFQNCGIFCW